MHFDMHSSDETTGHGSVEPAHEIDDTDLSDEALDRARMKGAVFSSSVRCVGCLA
jgi:hypothetical protein